MKISKREFDLLITLMVVIAYFGINSFLLEPIKNEISQLEYDKETLKISEPKKDINLKKDKDVILDLERKFSGLVNVDYMKNEKVYAIDDKEIEVIQIKVNGQLENVLKAEKIIKDNNNNNEILNIDIKNKSNNDESLQEGQNIVECTLDISR